MARMFRELRDPETGRWLPKEVWYQGIEVRLRVAKDVLGEK